jgi:Rad/Gem-related GTP binding protein 1
MWTNCSWVCWHRFASNWRIRRNRGGCFVLMATQICILLITSLYLSPGRDLFRKRSYRKSKRRACSPLGVTTTCLSGNSNTNPSTPVGQPGTDSVGTPQNSAQSRWVCLWNLIMVVNFMDFFFFFFYSPRKYRGSRTSASLKVKGLLGRVWARDSKSKSCENLHVL